LSVNDKQSSDTDVVGDVVQREVMVGVFAVKRQRCWWPDITVTDWQSTYLTTAVYSGADSIGHVGTCPPTFTNGLARGHRE